MRRGSFGTNGKGKGVLYFCARIVYTPQLRNFDVRTHVFFKGPGVDGSLKSLQNNCSCPPPAVLRKVDKDGSVELVD